MAELDRKGCVVSEAVVVEDDAVVIDPFAVCDQHGARPIMVDINGAARGILDTPGPAAVLAACEEVVLDMIAQRKPTTH